MTAVSCVGLTKVVAIGDPFKFAADPATNPVPVRVTVVSGLPAGAVLGLRLVSVGAGLVTANVCGADVPPASATVTGRLPPAARAAAGMTAVSCVGLTKVVATGVPLKLTAAALVNPVPVRVIVVSGLPAGAVFGLRPAIVGTAAAATVNVCGADVVPLAFITATGRLPAVARLAAGMTAVSCVGLTNVVATAVPLTVATESAAKFVPVRVTVVVPDPAGAEFGLMLPSVGAGSAIVRVFTVVPPRVAPPPLGVPRVMVSVLSTPGRGGERPGHVHRSGAGRERQRAGAGERVVGPGHRGPAEGERDRHRGRPGRHPDDRLGCRLGDVDVAGGV